MDRNRRRSTLKGENIIEHLTAPPTASLDNPIFPRKKLSLSEKRHGIQVSMLHTRYSGKPPPKVAPFGPQLPPVNAGAGEPMDCKEALPPLPGAPEGASRYTCTQWFQHDKAHTECMRQASEDIYRRCPKVLDIPQSDPAAGRYPYRYSSAGPCSSGKTLKERDLQRCGLHISPRREHETKDGVFDWRDIVILHEYETTEMLARLRPLQSMAHNRPPCMPVMTQCPSTLLHRLQLKKKPQTEFDDFVNKSIHRQSKDVLANKRLYFRLMDVNTFQRSWNESWAQPWKKRIIEGKNRRRNIKIKSKKPNWD